MFQLSNEFKSEKGVWTYCPNRKLGVSSFHGEPVASKKVMELLGDRGLKELPTTFKNFNKGKSYLFGNEYGEDYHKYDFCDTQYYFLDVNKK